MADEHENIISEEEIQAAISPPDLQGRINLRVDKALQAEIDDIAEDTRYPFNSASEVVRYCLLAGIPRIREWKPGETLLGNIRAANALVLRDKIQCETLDLLTRLDERINWYIDNAFYDEVIDLVARVRGYFDGFAANFWGEYIQSEIDKKFAAWMDVIDGKTKGT